jgi:hypothetical protein
VKTCFVLGEQGGSDGGEVGFNNVPVEDAEYNDPRTLQLDTEDLDPAPAYIRFATASSNPGWCIERVKVTVIARGGAQHHFDNCACARRRTTANSGSTSAMASASSSTTSPATDSPRPAIPLCGGTGSGPTPTGPLPVTRRRNLDCRRGDGAHHDQGTPSLNNDDLCSSSVYLRVEDAG